MALQKCSKFIEKRKTQIRKKILDNWVLSLLKRKSRRERERKISEIIHTKVTNRILGALIGNWIDSYRSKIAYKLMKKRADKISKIKLLRKYIKGFSLNRFVGRMRKTISNDATSFYKKSLLKTALAHLKEHHLNLNLNRRRLYSSIKFWSKMTYMKAFKSFSLYRNYKKSKKELENHSRELYLDNLRRDAMTLWLKAGLFLKDKKEGAFRDHKREEEEKTWNLVRKYADRWLEKVRSKKIKRDNIAIMPAKMPPLQSVNPAWVDTNAPKKARRAPRRLDGMNNAVKIDLPKDNDSIMYRAQEENKLELSKTIDVDLSSIIKRPIRAPSPFALSEKIMMTPLNHSRSQSQFGSPKIAKRQTVEDRIEEIEVKLLNLKYDKQKFREFQNTLRQNPENQWLERQIYELKRKLQDEMPNVRALYDELQHLKNQ